MKKLYDFIKRYIVYIVLIYFCFFKRIEYFVLLNKGSATTAVVFNIRNVGAKGTIYTDYKFIVDGETFMGTSANIKGIQIGDSIELLYADNQ